MAAMTREVRWHYRFRNFSRAYILLSEATEREVGELNQVVHIWGYRDYDHMDEARAQVASDPDWTGKYLPAVRGLIVKQKTWLMLSPDFAPQPA